VTPRPAPPGTLLRDVGALRTVVADHGGWKAWDPHMLHLIVGGGGGGGITWLAACRPLEGNCMLRLWRPAGER